MTHFGDRLMNKAALRAALLLFAFSSGAVFTSNQATAATASISSSYDLMFIGQKPATDNIGAIANSSASQYGRNTKYAYYKVDYDLGTPFNEGLESNISLIDVELGVFTRAGRFQSRAVGIGTTQSGFTISSNIAEDSLLQFRLNYSYLFDLNVERPSEYAEGFYSFSIKNSVNNKIFSKAVIARSKYSNSVPSGKKVGFFDFEVLLVSGESKSFQIDSTVRALSSVPLPAGGILLLASLAGLLILRPSRVRVFSG